MKKFYFILLLVIHALVVNATAQYSEVITINDSTYQLCNLLLENEPNFKKLQRRLPQQTTTALWRNYIGHWKIQNDSLFLDSVCTFVDGKIKAINIDDIYHPYKTPTGYFPSWVNSPLSVRSGNLVLYIHSGWDSIYENNDTYNVKNGIAKLTRTEKARSIFKDLGDIKMSRTIQTFPYHKFPEITTRVMIKGSYDKFDKNGIPTHFNTIIISNTKIEESELSRLKEEISQFVVANQLFPCYMIGNKHVTAPYTWPLAFDKHNDFK